MTEVNELEHFGVKGMKWGVRNESSTSSNSNSSAKTGMSTKKKVAIGAGVVVGAVAVGYLLGSRGKIPISKLDGGKDNVARLKGGKAVSTLSQKQWNTRINEQRHYTSKIFSESTRVRKELDKSLSEINAMHKRGSISSDTHKRMVKEALDKATKQLAGDGGLISQIGPNFPGNTGVDMRAWK